MFEKYTNVMIITNLLPLNVSIETTAHKDESWNMKHETSKVNLNNTGKIEILNIKNIINIQLSNVTKTLHAVVGNLK